jgi:hypothetical protein
LAVTHSNEANVHRLVGRLINKLTLSLYDHSGAMPALDRLALVAVLPAERYLICQAAH